MNETNLITHFFMFLQTPPGPPAPSGGEMFARMAPMLVILFVIMYLFTIRPQRKQEQEKKNMLDSIKKNDKVVTIGGLYGVVHSIKNETLILTVADKTQLKFNRSAIQQVIKKESAEKEAKA